MGWGFNVPFLVLKARHPTPQCIRTSLLVIQVQCFARSSPFLTELYCLLSLNSKYNLIIEVFNGTSTKIIKCYSPTQTEIRLFTGADPGFVKRGSL